MPITPFMIYAALFMGAAAAFLAYRREKNPYLWFGIGFLFGMMGVVALFFIGNKKKNTVAAAVEPVLSLGGPLDKFWYYLDENHKQQGPMSRDAVHLAWKEGKVTLSTFVWNEEMADWKPLKEVVRGD